MLPVLPDLYMEISGEGLSASAIYGGWLMFSFAIMQFVFAPVLGNLSDAYGRRPILFGSLIVLTINYLIMGFAETLTVLFIGRIISGIGSATNSTCSAYIADITEPEERAQYFGYIGAAFGLGFVIGPVIGGFLGDFGSRVPFFAIAALIFSNLLLGLVFFKESLPTENRRPFNITRANPFSALQQMRKFKTVFGLIGVILLFNLGHHALPAVWSFYGMESFGWDAKEVGFSLGFVGLLMVFVQGYLIQIIIPKVGMRVAGIIGLAFTSIAMVGFAIATEAWMAYAAIIPMALGALGGPAINGIASGQIGADQQGELQGALASMMSLTSIISPPVMTIVFGVFTTATALIYLPGAPYLLAGVLTVMSLALFIRTTTGFVHVPEESNA